MSGVKGRSGRRPLPVATHILRGTFRKSRHGARLLAPVEGATARQVAVPFPPAALTAGLRERGLEFVLDLWTTYEKWEPQKLALLHEAGTVTDSLSEYQTILARDGKVVTTARGNELPHPLLRLQAQAQRTLALLIDKLDLRED